MDWDALTEELDRHLDFWSDDDRGLIVCDCGEFTSPFSEHGHAQHLREVVQAWFEKQTHEEFGIQYERHADPTMDNPSGVVTNTVVLRDERQARNVMDSAAPLSAENKRAVRRTVTDWGHWAV